MNALDRFIGFFSPQWGLKRAIARRALRRGYSGAEQNRVSGKRPNNQSADSEALGPSGADAVRAWARKFVRDNAIATGIVETIATAVIGCGIHAQSMVEDVEGNDIESINDARDAVWQEWCDVCDVNGQMTFAEIQFLAVREIVEAGECLIRFVPVKDSKLPVPLALELIEADRIAVDRDTFAYRTKSDQKNRVVRGVEMTDTGKPVAYWIYPEHPNSPYVTRNTEPVRVPASEVLHLFRKDRIGQTRGVSWFAPIQELVRDLGIYWENELQASAIASCFTAAITSDGTAPGLNGADGEDTVDENGNTYDRVEPGIILRLNKGESFSAVNPSRPNAAADAWISLIQRLIGVGVGLGYEKVSRDFSKTSYSSARTSELEDRRRFKRFQQYLISHLCQPVWDRFCEAASIAGAENFPDLSDLLANRRGLTPVAWQVPEWEWVDPQNDQAASEAAIRANMSTLQRECAKNGINWRDNLRQRAKETAAEKAYGVEATDSAIGERSLSIGEALQKIYLSVGSVITTQEARDIIAAQYGIALPPENAPQSQESASATTAPASGTGELKGMGRRDFTNTNKAMLDILNQLKVGGLTETQARVQLSGLGYGQQTVDALIADMADGVLDHPEVAA